MKYIIPKNQEDAIEILANDYFSTNYIEVEKGHQYEFIADCQDFWIDSFIKKNANGFWNILLRNSKKRLKDHNCFLLCGTIEATDDGHFPIGTYKKWTAPKSGKLYFFANDHINEKYYRNNKGSIKLKVRRLS